MDERFSGLEKDEEEFKKNPSIYLAKSWARHYIENYSGKVTDKVNLLHKIKTHAINSKLSELVDICKSIDVEYSRIKKHYVLDKNDEYRINICEKLLKLGDELVEKLRNIK
mgnify:CR=1 FL=1